jgi:hypothetical protein
VYWHNVLGVTYGGGKCCVKLQTRSILRYALFWNVTQRRVVILYRRVKLSSWNSWPLKMGPIPCPETSVKYYHMMLRNIPEERRSQQHRGGSRKSRNVLRLTLGARHSLRVFLCGCRGLPHFLLFRNWLKQCWFSLKLNSFHPRGMNQKATNYIKTWAFCGKLFRQYFINSH